MLFIFNALFSELFAINILSSNSISSDSSPDYLIDTNRITGRNYLMVLLLIRFIA